MCVDVLTNIIIVPSNNSLHAGHICTQVCDMAPGPAEKDQSVPSAIDLASEISEPLSKSFAQEEGEEEEEEEVPEAAIKPSPKVEQVGLELETERHLSAMELTDSLAHSYLYIRISPCRPLTPSPPSHHNHTNSNTTHHTPFISCRARCLGQVCQAFITTWI